MQNPTQNSSIFDDNTKKFKEENTPLQFSTATSLSNLTIDEHAEPNSLNQAAEDNTIPDDLQPASESEDEDILAACISDGMQSSR